MMVTTSWTHSKYEIMIHAMFEILYAGVILSNHLVAGGFTSFDVVTAANPRSIEMACNKCPPFGNSVRNFALGMPKYR